MPWSWLLGDQAAPRPEKTGPHATSHARHAFFGSDPFYLASLAEDILVVIGEYTPDWNHYEDSGNFNLPKKTILVEFHLR